MRVGIDLGTSSVACTAIDGGCPRTWISKGLDFPVGVARKGDRILVGAEARRIREYEETIYLDNLKRRVFKEQSLGCRTELLFTKIVQRVKQIVEGKIKEKIDGVAVGIPNDFGLLHRRAYRSAFYDAYIENIQLIKEPAAAVIGYQMRQEKPIDGKFIVFDYGGGTTDITIGEWKNNVFELMYCEGNNRMGGRDLDYLVLELIKESWRRQTGRPFPINMDIARLRGQPTFFALLDLAEKIKIELSHKSAVTIENDVFEVPLKGLKITREDFERKALPDLANVRDMLMRFLNNSAEKPEEIDRILLTGGGMKIPKVRELIAEAVRPEAIIYEEGAVADYVHEGLAYCATKAQDFKLKDIYTHSIGLEVAGKTPSFQPIVQRFKPKKSVNDFTVKIERRFDMAPFDANSIKLLLVEEYFDDFSRPIYEPVAPIYKIDLEQEFGILKDDYMEDILGHLLFDAEKDEFEFEFMRDEKAVKVQTGDEDLKPRQFIDEETLEKKRKELKQALVMYGREGKGRILMSLLESLEEGSVEIEQYNRMNDIIFSLGIET